MIEFRSILVQYVEILPLTLNDSKVKNKVLVYNIRLYIQVIDINHFADFREATIFLSTYDFIYIGNSAQNRVINFDESQLTANNSVCVNNTATRTLIFFQQYNLLVIEFKLWDFPSNQHIQCTKQLKG